MEQKFKRGNLVKVLVGHLIWQSKDGEVKWIDIAPNDVGRKAIIEYSYSEKYGDGKPAKNNSYSIVWADTGSSMAWKYDNELELLEDGGEHLFTEAKAKREAAKKRNTDLKQIIETWDEKKGNLSSETILFLFDKIGYKSSFLVNGEFYALFADWEVLYPLFDLIMIAKIEQEVDGLIGKECPGNNRSKIIEFFNEVQAIKNQ